jgi:hypothetical protein
MELLPHIASPCRWGNLAASMQFIPLFLHIGLGGPAHLPRRKQARVKTLLNMRPAE